MSEGENKLAVVEPESAELDFSSPLVAFDRMSLMDVVEHKADVEKMIADNDGEIGGVMETIYENAIALHDGKIDKVAYVLDVQIPGHIEWVKSAAKKQIEQLEYADARLRGYVLDCINANEGKPLQGEMSALAAQNNPQTIELVDIEQVPNEFKKTKVSISVEFEATNEGARAYWIKFIEDFKKIPQDAYGYFRGDIEDSVKKAEARKLMVPPKPKRKADPIIEPKNIPGFKLAALVWRVVVKAGKAKPKTIKEKKK